MECVFLVLDLFSHISDALRGKLIGALAERYRVVVITQYLDSAAARSGGYFEHPNVSYEKLKISHPRFWPIANQLLRHSLVRAYDDFVVTRRFYYRPTHPLRVRALTAIGSVLPRRLAGTAPFTRLEQFMVRPSPAFSQLVASHRPKLLLTARPGLSPFEAEMIIFAKNIGIPTMAININYDNPYSVAKFFRNTDYLCVWNERMKQQIEVLHRYPSERVFVTGCLRFDHYFTDRSEGRIPSREAFLARKRLDPGRKTVAYLGPSPIMYAPRKEFFDILLDLKTSGALAGDPNILVRMHPHDAAEPYQGWDRIPGVCVERAGRARHADAETRGQKVEMEEEDLVNLTATLAHADVVVNFASTMIIESSIFDTPVINIAFPEEEARAYEFEFNRALAESGAVRMARSPNELAREVNAYLSDPGRDGAGRAALVEEYVRFTDGRSWQRIRDRVAEVLGRVAENEAKRAVVS